MMTSIPSQPSRPQTDWIYGLGSFALLYGALLYLYLHHVWPLGGSPPASTGTPAITGNGRGRSSATTRFRRASGPPTWSS